jgi:hypothetical protein
MNSMDKILNLAHMLTKGGVKYHYFLINQRHMGFEWTVKVSNRPYSRLDSYCTQGGRVQCGA